MKLVCTVQRVVLGGYGLVTGAVSLLVIIVPHVILRQLIDRPTSAPPVLYLFQALAGAQLGLAIVALVAATMPRPSRALVGAITIAALASAVGPAFSGFMQTIPWPELQVFKKWIVSDGLVAATLLVTVAWRASSGARERRSSTE